MTHENPGGRECERCRWWFDPRPEMHMRLNVSKNKGKCYRFPELVATWCDHWCGEFDEREGLEPK